MREDRTGIRGRWYPYEEPSPEVVLRMICLPYAGGGAAIFRLWQSRLPSFVEVYPIELPGRGARWKEAPISHMPLLIEAMSSAIMSLLDKPFIFFGHSMGGLICYELAQYLGKHCSIGPAQLVVSGCPAPHVAPEREQCYRLPDAEFLERIGELNGTPPEILGDLELMQLVLPTLRADFTIVDTYDYSPSPQLKCPITAIGGTDDVEVNVTDLLAWREHTASNFSHQMFPGDHFFINAHRDQVIALLARVSAQVVSRGVSYASLPLA